MTTTTTSDTHISDQDAWELVRNGCYKHLPFDYMWCEFGTRGRGLTFTPGGMARTGQIFGWIAGMNEDIGAIMAGHFIRQMDLVANYGGPINDEGATPWVIQMGDDGTFGGYNMLYYHLRKKEWIQPSSVRLSNMIVREYGFHTHRYTYSHNGGLLFHGFERVTGKAPVLGVKVGTDHNPWSLHT